MRAYYRSTVGEFLEAQAELILDKLENGLAADGFSRRPDERSAWRGEINTLKQACSEIKQSLPESTTWGLLLEYPIPGRQKRLDAVLLTPRGLIVIEFKIGRLKSLAAAKSQLLEYCWNLRDFHCASAGHVIAPILVPTESEPSLSQAPLRICDSRGAILSLQISNDVQLPERLLKAFQALPETPQWSISLEAWDDSRISPSQSIIDSTRQLFRLHSVREIDHRHADNTDEVVKRISDIVNFSRQNNQRSICFVTGVPGAGKTLVGLRVAYHSDATALAESAPCFASGNIKLLKVLAKALGLNVARSRTDVRHTVHDLSAPLWDVHRFAQMHLSDASQNPPSFRVVVFDEAQRVWTAAKVEKASNDRATRGNRGPEISKEFMYSSEPEHLLHVMERFKDWCVVVALVGGGQEIHDGEAGLKEWGAALERRPGSWHVWASPEALHGGASLAGQSLFASASSEDNSIHEDNLLHLQTTRRSFRAERLTEWVNFVIDGNASAARSISQSLPEFRIELIRDLPIARSRLRDFTQDDQRIGLLASSGAKRLRAEGVETQKQFRDALNWPKWFLDPSSSTDSSNRLEVAATEFECQGLELDHICLCWGTDFVHLGTQGWCFRPARGKKLRPISYSSEGPYVLNKYRVLLTRAREGMIIFVPRGDPSDPTRPSEILDSTADFLKQCGVICLKEDGFSEGG